MRLSVLLKKLEQKRGENKEAAFVYLSKAFESIMIFVISSKLSFKQNTLSDNNVNSGCIELAQVVRQ